MDKVTPCLWFDGNAEEAANFYVSLLPDSRIDNIMRSPADNPSMKEGGVLMVDFTLAGRQYSGLNGGPQFPFTEAVSFVIHCEDQAEVDRLWDALIADGGQPSPVRLAEGQVRPLLADRAAGNARHAELERPRRCPPGDGGDDDDGEARPRRAAPRLPGRIEKMGTRTFSRKVRVPISARAAAGSTDPGPARSRPG
jgi:predicted 3-demethylubiquinone-9 3-methyltransferase (glyoxalase superfamily)